MNKKQGRKILVIPDAHARPGVSNERFDALGQFILDKQPDVIVNIGDLADMGSLCSYDKGQGVAEGRRYQDDIAVANDALRRYTKPTFDYLKRYKASKWKPEWHVTLGNHENRIDRAANQSPELLGKLAIDDIEFKKHKHKVHEFLKPVSIDGICFQHFFTSGILGKPIGGVNHARTLVLKNYQSSVCGHSHSRDYWEDVRADGKRVFGLVVGCYDVGHHQYTTEQRRWWSGLVCLHEARDGTAEPAFYSTDYVLRRYL
ncbi:MAG: metallophosphoesterase [Sulfuritalea sp.]|jgi:predicted MPP superfamily phosphohydrolase|nr:metallophosphoesterase [Sulfuritalea sp.]